MAERVAEEFNRNRLAAQASLSKLYVNRLTAAACILSRPEDWRQHGASTIHIKKILNPAPGTLQHTTTLAGAVFEVSAVTLFFCLSSCCNLLGRPSTSPQNPALANKIMRFAGQLPVANSSCDFGRYFSLSKSNLPSWMLPIRRTGTPVESSLVLAELPY
jgi:hypothetical protein